MGKLHLRSEVVQVGTSVAARSPRQARCYRLTHMEKVGVRELRQNLSRHLARVKDGESLLVTERGREVAVIDDHTPTRG
jgi:prevent-host-death family protein